MRQEAKASLSADLTFPRSIENFATLLLEFSSLWRARERIMAEHSAGNLLERQLGVFEAVVIELNPRSRLGSGQSHALRLLFHSRGSVSPNGCRIPLSCLYCISILNCGDSNEKDYRVIRVTVGCDGSQLQSAGTGVA